MLDLSDKRLAAERDRYGLTKTQDYLPTELGPAPVDAYGMAANPATAALSDAARQLLDALTPLQEATKKLEAIQVYEGPVGGEFDTGLRPTAPDPAALAAAQEEVRSTQRRYLLLRNEKEAGFPVLASFAAYDFLHTYNLKGVRQNLETVSRGSAGGDQTAELVAGDVFQRLENIAKVRAALADGSLNVWSADNLVGMAKAGLGVTPGSLEDRIVDQKVADDKSDRMLRDLFIGVLAMALGLLAAPLTSGGSVAVAAGVAATAGGAGLSATLAIEHIQQYQLEKAANATDFDKARVLSSADPSLFWLALDVVLAGLDIAAAAKVFAKLAPLARQAVHGAGQEAKAALDLLEKTAEADAPALGRTVRQSAETTQAGAASATAKMPPRTAVPELATLPGGRHAMPPHATAAQEARLARLLDSAEDAGILLDDHQFAELRRRLAATADASSLDRELAKLEKELQLKRDVQNIFHEGQQLADPRSEGALEGTHDVGTTTKPRLKELSDAEMLAAELTKAKGPRPPGHEAHHIIPKGMKEADEAREILREAGIGINDVENGIWLPKDSSVPNVSTVEIHSKVHTSRAIKNMTAELREGAKEGPEGVRRALQRISETLSSGRFER